VNIYICIFSYFRIKLGLIRDTLQLLNVTLEGRLRCNARAAAVSQVRLYGSTFDGGIDQGLYLREPPQEAWARYRENESLNMGNFVLAYPTEEYPDQPTQGLQGLYDRILAGASDLFQVQGGHSSYFTSLYDMTAYNKSNDNKKINDYKKDDYDIDNDYTNSYDRNDYDNHNNDDINKKKLDVNGNHNHNHDRNHSLNLNNDSMPNENQNPSRPIGIRYLFESNHAHCFHRKLLHFDSSLTSSMSRVHSFHSHHTCTLLIYDIDIFE
jgi:hypothetical protein